MPRLGDDPNVATAYPERDRMNLRGRGMRQMVNMVAIILIFFFIMFKLFTNNYKDDTKNYMAKSGMDEKRIKRIFPQTLAEAKAAKEKEEVHKKTIEENAQHMSAEVANLTLAVFELQDLAKETGTVIKNPIVLRPKEEEKEGEGAGNPEVAGDVKQAAEGTEVAGDTISKADETPSGDTKEQQGGDAADGGGKQTRRSLRSRRNRLSGVREWRLEAQGAELELQQQQTQARRQLRGEHRGERKGPFKSGRAAEAGR